MVYNGLIWLYSLFSYHCYHRESLLMIAYCYYITYNTTWHNPMIMDSLYLLCRATIWSVLWFGCNKPEYWLLWTNLIIFLMFQHLFSKIHVHWTCWNKIHWLITLCLLSVYCLLYNWFSYLQWSPSSVGLGGSLPPHVDPTGKHLFSSRAPGLPKQQVHSSLEW